jgi:microcystin-dependent protein
MAVSDYSTNPDANTTIAGINIGELCNASNMNDAIRQLMADIKVFATSSTAPTGALQGFAGASAPAGWLICDGSAVSRTTYATLFAAIGSTWGAGDGNTTFNLPDYRGKVLVGAGGGFSLAAVGGEASHTLSTSEVPSQSVTVTGTTGGGSAHTHGVTDPGHTHTVPIGYTGAGTVGSVSGASSTGSFNESTASSTTGVTIGSESAHTHSLSASGSTNGGGGAHNNMQPYAVANVIIKI